MTASLRGQNRGIRTSTLACQRLPRGALKVGGYWRPGEAKRGREKGRHHGTVDCAGSRQFRLPGTQSNGGVSRRGTRSIRRTSMARRRPRLPQDLVRSVRCRHRKSQTSTVGSGRSHGPAMHRGLFRTAPGCADGAVCLNEDPVGGGHAHRALGPMATFPRVDLPAVCLGYSRQHESPWLHCHCGRRGRTSGPREPGRPALSRGRDPSGPSPPIHRHRAWPA